MLRAPLAAKGLSPIASSPQWSTAGAKTTNACIEKADGPRGRERCARWPARTHSSHPHRTPRKNTAATANSIHPAAPRRIRLACALSSSMPLRVAAPTHTASPRYAMQPSNATLPHHAVSRCVLPSSAPACYASRMAHLHRFYVPPDTPDEGEVLLSPDEAHHALRVARLRDGQEAAVFDGCGREWTSTLRRTGKRDVVVVLEKPRRQPKPETATDLGSGMATSGQAHRVRRAPRHGIGRVRLRVLSCRTFGKGARFQREVGEARPSRACKQCGRLWLPEFRVAGDLKEVLETAQGDRLIAAMDVPPIPLREALTGGQALLLVGPEGDFSGQEVDMALAAGARPCSPRDDYPPF